MTRFHRASSSPISLVPSRARRSGPVRPNDERPHGSVVPPSAGRRSSGQLAARTRALILPSNPEWQTLWLASIAGLMRVWRGLTGAFGKR